MGAASGPNSGPGTARTVPWAPLIVLFSFIGVYIAVSFWLSTLRLEEFQTSNWDLGIFQQALWSTYHGHPMYEAGDWESYGSLALLQVHPSFSLFLVVPFYALYPSPYTLFALQSVVTGAAGFPLFRIALRVLGRPWPSVGFAGLYLVSAPVLVANTYDFHLESFLPLEISLLFLLWLAGRYYLGLLVAGVAMLTIEVVPFLVAFLALYFLLPPILPGLRGFRLRQRGSAGSAREALGWAFAEAGAWWTRRDVRWSTALLLVAVVAYPVLRGLEWYALPTVLPAAPNVAVGVALVPSNAPGLGLALDWSFRSLETKLWFWVAMVGLFAFLPLLAPRVLLLELPWFFFTIQSSNAAWSTFGFQYTFVAVAPLAIAAVYGYPRGLALARWVNHEVTQRLAPQRSARTATPNWRPQWPALRARNARLVAAVPFVVLALLIVGANFWLGPLNPRNQTSAGPLPGYVVEFHPPPGYSYVVEESKLDPSSAYLLASSNLFPLVANDLNAYTLLWTPDQPGQLPFGFGHPPQYAFLSEDQYFAVPPWFIGDLHHSDFGLRAVVWVAPPGAVYLYELGYEGPTDVIGPP